jgi:hypothetical protein
LGKYFQIVLSNIKNFFQWFILYDQIQAVEICSETLPNSKR